MTWPATDEIVRLVREAPPAWGLHGAKVTGGGSGGTVALACRSDSEPHVREIARRYAERTGNAPPRLQRIVAGRGGVRHTHHRKGEHMNVLVTGAAGYIGSHAVRCLNRAGHTPVALDNLSRGHREALPPGVPFVELDVRDTDAVTGVLEKYAIDTIMHFAALAYVGESVDSPLLYYDNNTRGTLSVLTAVSRTNVKRFVFSSTCATYGEPEQMPIREDTPQRPINPYGWSKLFSERMLRDHAATDPGFSYAALRYFNVAGCAADGSLGEDHSPETHLIPVILQAVLGKRSAITIFGEDYPTPDGTCIRDYVYVEDLVDAHVQVMQSLKPGQQALYNLGIGRGHSVKEIIDAARGVVGRPFRVDTGPRRPGDPPSLYADASKIARELGWKARTTDIRSVIESAWRWAEAHPNGYAAMPPREG